MTDPRQTAVGVLTAFAHNDQAAGVALLHEYDRDDLLVVIGVLALTAASMLSSRAEISPMDSEYVRTLFLTELGQSVAVMPP